MAVLFKGLRWVHKGKSTIGDFIFDNGEIIPAGSYDSSPSETIIADGWICSEGWVDLRVSAGEPGHEHKETIESLCNSLHVSGFSAAVLTPNTDPVIENKGLVDFLLSKSKAFPVEIIPQAAVTKGTQGEDLTEILDLHFQSGVTIFGEGKVSLSNSDRYLKIVQYLQRVNGILFDHAYDPLLAIFGQMHEGEVSTQLGMKGIPRLAEEVAIQRNLELLRYAGGRVHFQTISTAKSVDLIKQAKKEGLNITADVSIYQLIFNDQDLFDFDPNLKVNPPFREKEDRDALIEGLKDGTIDALVSNHQPEDFDSKFMEFDLAAFGMTGLQTFLPALNQLQEELGWELLLEKITTGPAKVLDSKISRGFTIFDPKEKWIYNEDSNHSLASNNPWFGKELLGKVKYRIYEGNILKINE